MPHPRHFYKYCTARVGRLMLENRKVRWSSPLRYNDPFDCHFAIDLKFDLRRAGREFKRRFLDAVYAEELPAAAAYHLGPFRAMAQHMPRQLMSDRLGNMAELCKQLWSEPAEAARLEWKERMANYRLFCVCEGRDNLLLWAHYTDSHKGIAFELDGAADTGMPLSVAERVHYSNRAPAMHTRKEWIEVGLGLRPLASGLDVWRKLVTTKSRAWAYEREWRIVASRRSGETEDFVDLPFPAENITGIFLGCRIEPEDKDAILQLASGPLAHVQIHQAKQSGKRFALEFERIR